MLLTVVIGISLLALISAQQVPGNVAFTAAITEDRTVNAGNTIVFNTVLNNIGTGYDPITGVFTAPRGGVYTIAFNAVTQANSKVYVDLVHNDVYQVSAYGSSGWGSYATASTTLNLRLKKGDRVVIKARHTAYLYAEPKEIYATFTGFLVGLV
uniref:C1q domain-containing protein n=1 Tax=Arion vulgaris TaxID=1028688 RepID=A0A0B6ZJ78_9EUPU